MVEEFLTGLEFLIMGLWIFAVLFFAHKVNKKTGQNAKTPYNSQKEQYEYSTVPERQTELNISEEERKLKEWLNDIFGTNIEIDRPQPVIYKEEPSYDEVQEYSFARYEKEDIVEEKHTVTTTAVRNPYSIKVAPAFHGLNKEQLVQGIIMSEVLGKPRALKPIKSRYYKSNKTNLSA